MELSRAKQMGKATVKKMAMWTGNQMALKKEAWMAEPKLWVISLDIVTLRACQRDPTSVTEFRMVQLTRKAHPRAKTIGMVCLRAQMTRMVTSKRVALELNSWKETRILEWLVLKITTASKLQQLCILLLEIQAQNPEAFQINHS